LRYREAGVDLEAGDKAVELYKESARRASRPEVLGGLGGFGGLFALPEGYRQPVLVAGADGVGTKLKLAFRLGGHRQVGIDCVAMCVNDILTVGAEPLFFLDYLATGKLDPEQAAAVVSGIAEGCRLAGAALLGGETAEMPGFYPGGEYDLAGFAVGVAEKERLVTGGKVRAGDVIIGLASDGIHSNGYSLVRRILGEDFNLYEMPQGFQRPLGEELITPTRIYVRPVLDLLTKFPVHAMAHITGGGILGNLERVIPEGLVAVVEKGSWLEPPVFAYLQQQGQVDEGEMFRVFNMGLGFILVLHPDEADGVITHFKNAGECPYAIGRIEAVPPDDYFLASSSRRVFLK